MAETGPTLVVIGVARTPFGRREDAPFQPTAMREARGTVEILPEYRKALADLAGFSRIWLLFWFHRNEGWVARVKPLRGGPKRGLFATRSPHRPSPLGISSLELLSVDAEAGRLEVKGIDLLDGTPVVDIKPYIPDFDAWPEARAGWLEGYREVEPRLKKPRRP